MGARTPPMRASRAYITGLGTTGVLLCFALLLLVVVSAILTFRGWPAGAAGEDSAAVSIGSDRGTGAAPVRREVSATSPAAKARSPRSAARTKRSRSRARGSVHGVSQSGSHARDEAVAGRSQAAAPAAPGTPANPAQHSQGPQAPEAPKAPKTPNAPNVGDVTTGLADTTQQVTEGASGAVGGLAPAPVGQTVSDTGQAVSDLVRQTGDTTQHQLDQLPHLP
jgi:hypothetical protein